MLGCLNFEYLLFFSLICFGILGRKNADVLCCLDFVFKFLGRSKRGLLFVTTRRFNLLYLCWFSFCFCFLSAGKQEEGVPLLVGFWFFAMFVAMCFL